MKILTDQVQKFEVHLVFLIFADENSQAASEILKRKSGVIRSVAL